MSNTYTAPVAPFGSLTVYRVVSAIDNARTALLRWNATRVTRLALVSLSDELLEDIGLNRSQAHTITPGMRRQS